MIIKCTSNDGFEDQLTASSGYAVKQIGQNSYLIENDNGQARWYGKARFEIKSDELLMSHEACDAFWEYWKSNGETHKHGYYESTWGAIRAYLEKAASTKDQRAA